MDIAKHYKNVGHIWRKSFDEVDFHLSQTKNEAEIQRLLTSVVIISTKLCILNHFLKKEDQISFDQKIVSSMTKYIPNPNDTLEAALRSLQEVQSSGSVDDFKKWELPLTWIIYGFVELNVIESLVRVASGDLLKIRSIQELFLKAKRLLTKDYKFSYLEIWGEGMSLLMENLVLPNPGLAQKANMLLEDGYNIMLSTNPKFVFPITDDLFFDMSPFYLGVSYCLLNRLDIGQLFISLAVKEEQVPNYIAEFPQKKNVRTTMEFLLESKMASTLLVSKIQEPPTKQESVLDNLDTKERLKRRLDLYGFREVEVPGDGNCQMSSLSFQIFGNFENAQDVRLLIVGWLRSNGDLELPENNALLKDFSYLEWNKYCDLMEKNGTWGDHITLIAAAEIFNRSIVIISSIPGSNFITEIVPMKGPSEGSKPMYLSHYAEFHFTTLININEVRT